MEKANKELNARPEIQEVLKKNLEHHYFNEWPKSKLPALGGLSPLQAARRKNERPRLEALIDDMDRMQNMATSKMPEIDTNKLRRLLGLPEKPNKD